MVLCNMSWRIYVQVARMPGLIPHIPRGAPAARDPLDMLGVLLVCGFVGLFDFRKLGLLLDLRTLGV